MSGLRLLIVEAVALGLLVVVRAIARRIEIGTYRQLAYARRIATHTSEDAHRVT